MTHNPEAAGDHRRATALVCHYGRQELEGVNAVLQEAVEAGRVTPLIVAVCALHEGVVPILLTEDGLACLTRMVYTLSEDQDADQDCARAARLTICHSERDDAGFNTVIREAAAAERLTELIVGLLTTFTAMCPQLYSQLGLQVLQRNILNWAAKEEADE